MSCYELITNIVGIAFVFGIIFFIGAYFQEAERAKRQIESARNRIEPKGFHEFD